MGDNFVKKTLTNYLIYSAISCQNKKDNFENLAIFQNVQLDDHFLKKMLRVPETGSNVHFCSQNVIIKISILALIEASQRKHMRF